MADASPEATTLCYPYSVLQQYNSKASADPILSNTVLNVQREIQTAAVEVERLLKWQRERLEDGQGNEEETQGHVKDLDENAATIDKSFKSCMTSQMMAAEYLKAIRQTGAVAENHRLPTDVVLSGANIKDYNTAPLIHTVFDQSYKQSVANLEAMGETAKYRTHQFAYKAYEAFRNKVFDTGHEADEERPPLEQFFDDYEEDELVVGREVLSYKCPLTKQYYEDPVTSSVCGHSFTRTAIMDVISKHTESTIKCPIPACSSYFGASQLKRAPQLQVGADARRQRAAKESQRLNSTIDRL